MKFELDDKQIKKLNKWTKKLKKKYGEVGLLEYRFTPTGIGDVVEVYSKTANKTINLTDVDSW